MGILSGNILKIIAAVCMLIDHVGALLFPEVRILRIIGRIAFPIFAYMIAEGCRYTRNKRRYFLTIFIFATVCQIVYYAFSRRMYFSILFTFSLAIVMIFMLQHLKTKKNASSALLFILTVAMVYLLNEKVTIDYGFWGCMTPVFASAAQDVKKTHNHMTCVLTMTLCLIILARLNGGSQPYSMLSVPLLLLYSGKRGKLNMKYFFYIFYPVHLVILHGIAMLIT